MERPIQNRAQSNVVGVALLLGIVIISMSVLIAGAGILVERQAASADATRMAAGLDSALSSVETTGVHREQLSFSSGTLQPVDRQLRILDGATVVRSVDVDALVFTTENHRVAFVGGAIVRGHPGNAWLYTEPLITASVGDSGGVLIVSVSRINTTDSVSGTGGVTTTLRMNVTHRREFIGNGTYSVAIESTTPEPFVRYFTEQGRTVERRDLDGDGIESVIVTYKGRRATYLVIHDFNMEIHNG